MPEVINVNAVEPKWDVFKEAMPENPDFLKTMLDGRNESVLLSAVEQAVLRPVGEDIATRFADKQIGLSTLIVTNNNEPVTLSEEVGERSAIAYPLNNLEKFSEILRGGQVDNHGRGADLVKDNRLSTFGAGVTESVGRLMRFIHRSGANLTQEFPALAVYDNADRENPVLMGVYPLDVSAFEPFDQKVAEPQE